MLVPISNISLSYGNQQFPKQEFIIIGQQNVFKIMRRLCISQAFYTHKKLIVPYLLTACTNLYLKFQYRLIMQINDTKPCLFALHLSAIRFMVGFEQECLLMRVSLSTNLFSSNNCFMQIYIHVLKLLH